jgi:hypothetical protein
MQWFVHLTGDNDLLNDLLSYLTEEVACMKKVDNICYLYSTFFDGLNNSSEVLKVARKLIILINGAAKLVLDTNKTIGFDRISSIDTAGIQKNYVFLEGTAYIKTSVKCELNGMEEKQGDNIITKWVQKGYHDEGINILSELLDGASSKWSVLYKRAELVKKYLGGWDKISAKGWCSKNKLDLFKRTAQDYKAIGVKDARHIRDYKKLENPMTYPKAKNLIRAINIKWIKEILGS